MSAAVDSAALLADQDVLQQSASLEINGWQQAQALGGLALLHWRDDFLAASTAQVKAQPSATLSADTPLLGATYQQVIVAAQRDRQATLYDGLRAWISCAPGGRILLHGSNEIGIRTSAKQLAALLQVEGETLVSRAHARVLCFTKPPSAIEPSLPPLLSLISPAGLSLMALPGVFAAGRLDRGSEVLLRALQMLAGDLPNPQRVLDLGCGCGVLGLEAAQYWPTAQITLADADARACCSASENARRLGLAESVTVAWWDSAEDPPAANVDLVVSNPPWHHRGAVDRGPGLRMCEAVGQALRPGATALIVATKTQPFEHTLLRYGALLTVLEDDGFKVLRLDAPVKS